MTDDQLVEVYIIHYEPHVDINEMSNEEYEFYKKATIDTTGFAIFRLRVAIDNFIDTVIEEVKRVLTRRK